MARTRISVVVCLCVLVSLLLAVDVSAQVARVFLSGTGDDLNDCSNAATPCRSLQGAINQAPVNGEVIILTSGGFGTATITKSLTVNAPAGVVAFNARTITVTIGSTDKVVLRGLAMNGAVFGDAYGVLFNAGGKLVIENSVIAGFNVGIKQEAPGSYLVVQNCEIRNNTGDGILAMPSSMTATYLAVNGSRLENNGSPATGGSGIDVYDGVRASVSDCVASGNNRGYQLVGNAASGSFMVLDRVVASGNVAGINVNGNNQVPVTIRVTNSTITGNSAGLQKTGAGLIVSYQTNHVWGNTTDGTFSALVAQQ